MMTKPAWSGELLRVPVVAERLGFKPATIRKMVMQRKIAFVRTSSRSVRIPESVVDEILSKGYRPVVSR